MFTWGRDTLVGLLGTSCYSALVEDKLVEVQQLVVDVEVPNTASVMPVLDLELRLKVGKPSNL